MFSEPDTAFTRTVIICDYREIQFTDRELSDGPTDSPAVRDALRAGFGVSLIPRPYVESDLRNGRLQSALEDWGTVETTLYAVYSSRQHLAPKIRAFLDFLIEAFNREAG